MLDMSALKLFTVANLRYLPANYLFILSHSILETYPLYYFVNYDEQSEYSRYLDSLTDQISIALSQVWSMSCLLD